MSKSNPVHPWRLGRTRALIFTQKSLNRAKTGVPHGTPKNFPRLGRDVSTMRKTQSTKINRKINFILHGLATRRLSVKKKVTRNSHFSRPAETDPNGEHGENYALCVKWTKWGPFQQFGPHLIRTKSSIEDLFVTTDCVAHVDIVDNSKLIHQVEPVFFTGAT